MVPAEPPTGSQLKTTESQESMTERSASVEFAVEEYKYLTAEIETAYKEIRILERQVCFGSVAIYVWLLTVEHPKNFNLNFAWWLPSALIALAWVRTVSYSVKVGRISAHIDQIHKNYDYRDSWEKKQQARLWNTVPGKYLAWCGGSSAVLWIAIFCLSIWIGYNNSLARHCGACKTVSWITSL